MVRPYLLDVNVLIALVWPNHTFHGSARRWFEANKAAGFRTCPITQLGFLRIFCNPRVTDVSMTPATAHSVLESIIRLPGHEFWPDDIPCSEMFRPGALIAGPKQFTDHYLTALAISRKGILATFDRAMLSGGMAKDTVELIDVP